MKKYVGIAGSAAGVLLAAPLKLPVKVLKIAQYVAIIAGIVKATDQDRDE